MKRLEKDNIINSVHPLMFWNKNLYKNEYNPLEYHIGGRGTCFLYKTNKYYYLITAKHNLDANNTEGIVKEMSSCHIFSNHKNTFKQTSLSHFNKNNTLKLRYIPINFTEKDAYYSDLCIFHIFDNFPDDKSCLYSIFPDFTVEDKGYMIGYPNHLKSNTDNIIECQKAIVELEISGIDLNNYLMTYSHNIDIEKLNGFSGSPLVQYSSSIDKYILFGMVIMGNSNIIKIVPTVIIDSVISEYEKRY